MTSGPQKSAATTWNEAPWTGWIETTGDALLILEAARRGLIPRVTRRLVDSERKMISSGSVFVFDEDESGIKRWTDGFFWSPSRILGNFLLYRETDKRGPGHKGARSQDSADDAPETSQPESHSLSRPKTESNSNGLGLDKLRERSLMGSLTNSYKFKSDGLMKKTFSLTIGGVAQHLISYYRIEDVENGRLRSPSSLPELASLDISPEYLDKTHFRNPPKVETGPDGVPRYRGEADDVETSPVITAPLSSHLPLLSDGRTADTKRSSKRFEPYGAAQLPAKRHRKRKSPEDRRSASQTPTPSPTFPDPISANGSNPSLAPVSPAYPAYYTVAPVAPGYGHQYTYPPPHLTAAPMQTQGSAGSQSYPVVPYNSSANHMSASGPPPYYGYPSPHAPYPPYQTWSSYPSHVHPQPLPPQRQQAPLERGSADES